eukprot:5465460-Pyramimonas_sp.AAC.1
MRQSYTITHTTILQYDCYDSRSQYQSAATTIREIVSIENYDFSTKYSSDSVLGYHYTRITRPSTQSVLQYGYLYYYYDYYHCCYYYYTYYC